jgi:hypothetical protein
MLCFKHSIKFEARILKHEARNPKFETNSKFKYQNPKQMHLNSELF